ncbi:ribbon-helix-helix domain-containing protein [Sneathiella chinensis]|nr:ribbon-helix-helix domain-containing protein [Sneathiella chinensis]
MNDEIVKYSVSIAGHRTSISLEKAFWTLFQDIALKQGKSLNALITEIDERRNGNLSSAVRLFVLQAVLDGTLPLPSTTDNPPS